MESVARFAAALGGNALISAALLVISIPAGAQGLPPPERNRGGNPASGEEYATEASAANQRASRISFLEHPDQHADNYRFAQRFASCAIGYNVDRARELLDQEGSPKQGSLDLGTFLKRNQGCAATRSALDRDFLRGAIAEALIVSPEWTAPLPAPATVDAAKAFMKSIKINNMDVDDPFSMGQLAAECRVSFAPTVARALLASEHGSEAEELTLSTLKTSTPQCDSFNGAKPLTSYFERAFAAQALYHWYRFSPSGSK